MPFYRCSGGGVKWIDLDLGQILLTKDSDNDIGLSYDNNVFIQSIGIDLVRAFPVETWENASVTVIDNHLPNHMHVTTSRTQKYHVIVRVYYQNPHSIQS